MARGQLRVPSAVALAVEPSQASSSVSANSATEPPDVAATFVAARQKFSFGYMAVSYEEPPARKAANDWRRFDDRQRGTFWSA
jgi:hypothetical protein